MIKMIKIRIAIIALVSLFALTFLLFPVIVQKNGDNIVVSVGSRVKIGDASFNVTVADTPNKRTKGLSGRKELSPDKGLIFVFEKSGIYPFWMKDMNFPIDIIWIDEGLRVVYVKENATPKSYPKTFTPNTPSLYVLEVNTGVIAKKKIKIGDEVFIDLEQ